MVIDSFCTKDEFKHDLPMYQGKLRFITFAVVIGVFLALGLAFWELHLGNYARALADAIFPLTAPTLVYLLWRRPRHAPLVLQIFALSIFLQQSSVSLYLFDLEQLIWIPTFPLVYFYLLGHKGWTWSLLLFAELWLFYFYYPFNDLQPRISLAAMNNFMAAYMMTAFLAWMYSREILYYQCTITKRAHYDSLTGIYNRVAWLERLQQEIALKKRSNQFPLTILMFDVDDFKQVNDRYGHPMGDQILEGVSRLVESRLRKSDVLGRWGGEEFVILLAHTNLNQAKVVAEELREQLASFRLHNITIHASFGVTQHQGNEDAAELLQRVDKLLYEAKAAGKNCVIAA